MELSVFFKSVIDSDYAPVVICDLEHVIVYMNPSAAERYKKRGGYALMGRSLLECHNDDSAEKIKKAVEWFSESNEHNRVYESHNEKENKDVYMIALRGSGGKLIGYYEKHEYRSSEPSAPYSELSL